MEAAAAGLGVVIAIEALVESGLRSGNLVCAHSAIRPTRNHLALIYDMRLMGDAAVGELKAWLLRITTSVREAPKA